MKFRMSLLATAVLALFAPFAGAQSFCNSTIIDQAKVIKNPAVVASAARTLINQGADVHVVTVNSASFQKYGQLAGVESYMEQTCPNWTLNGVRKANLFVVMVAPNDRAKNMFLGSSYAGAFDIPSTYSQLSNSFFKNGNFGDGLAAALQGTTSQALSFQKRQFNAQQQQRLMQPTAPPQTSRAYTQAPVYTTTPTQNADSGMSGLAIFFIVLLVLGVIGAIVYFVFRSSSSSTTTTTTDYDTTPSVDRTVYPPSPATYRRAYAASAPSHTTIIDNTRYDSSGNLLTGVLIGEALSRPSYNPNPTVIVEPSSQGYVAPSYVPDAPAPVADAPDSTWEQPTQQAADTNFEQPAQETTSFEPEPETPSYEAPSAPDTDFGSSSSGDTSF